MILSPADSAAAQVAVEVGVEVGKSGLPRTAQACLAALSAGELGTWDGVHDGSPFRCEFNFGQWTGSLAVFPPWGGVIDPHSGLKTDAIGAGKETIGPSK